MEQYSILTTVYKNDNPFFVKQSIDSMLAQSVKTDDYVVVADGPLSKELDALLEEYVASYPFFNIIRLPQNSGLGVALNVGVLNCKNELIARIDSDDISVADRCEKQLKAFDDNPELALIGSNMYEFDDTPEIIIDIKKMPLTSKEIYKYGKRRNPFNHSSVMYKKTVVLAVGNYSDRRRSQDIELWSKIVFQGYKCANIGEPLIYFRIDGDNRIKRKKKWTNIKSDLSVFKSNWKMGYSSFLDYMFVCLMQTGFFILPTVLAKKMYKLFFRKKK